MSDAFDKMLRARGEKVPERSPVPAKSPEPRLTESALPPAGENNAERSESVSTSPSESVSPAVYEFPPVDNLKDQILGALRRVRHSLAAAMEKAELWDVNGNTLTLTFRTAFEISFLEKERHEIEKIILESLNYTLQLKTQLKKHEEESVHNEVEEQVELVRSVFRGTIMKRSQS